MLRLSMSTFRERWQLFIGAIVTVCMGVALVQSSLLILISAATAQAPAGVTAMERAEIENAFTAAMALLGITLGLSVFLAAFIVSSTFAFTVAQRRRDLALLRLVGGARGQVRRLLLSEALLLGVLGTGAGIPVGLLVMRMQAWLLTELGFLPAFFVPRWQDWILGVSFGVGVAVALAGVFVASRRAAKVRPLEALRETGAATRVMTVSRWFFGLLFLAGAVAMVIVAGVAGPEGAVPLSINAALAAAVGLSALSPLLVPLVGRLFGLALRGSVLGGLAEANLRDGVRRSASTAAPLLVLVGLLVGQFGAMSTIAATSEQQQRRELDADLVVESGGRGTAQLADLAGVALVSAETRVPMSVTRTESDDDEVETENAMAVAVDPVSYQSVHRDTVESGSLDELRGRTVAIGPGGGGDGGLGLGGVVDAQVGDRTVALRIVAVLPASMTGGPDFLLPASLLTGAEAAAGSPRSLVRVAPGVDASAVAERVRASGLGEAITMDEWISRSASAQQDTQTGITAVVMGLGGLYALIAVINAVVIAAAERRREFAAARVSGLSRGQVVRMALIESWAVSAIGVLLGGVAASLTMIGITSALQRIAGLSVVDVPWALVAAVVAGAFVVVGLTSVWTTLSATRAAPVSLITARE